METAEGGIHLRRYGLRFSALTMEPLGQKAEILNPHTRPGKRDLDMVAATLVGPSQQGSQSAYCPQVSGDIVGNERGRRQAGRLDTAFGYADAGDRLRVVIETNALRPGTMRSEAA